MKIIRHLSLILISCFLSLPLQAKIKISGAGTAYNGFAKKLKKQAEKQSGVKFSLKSSNTGKGLVDLFNNKVPMSMTSEPLDISVDAGKVAKANIKNEKNLQLHKIMEVELEFVVNRLNPVSKITKAQAKDILTGKITNWKEVGGDDVPIRVFSDPATSGTCALVRKVVLDGEDYGKTRKAVRKIKMVAKNVADFKGGIGGVGSVFVDEKKVKKLDIGMEVKRPLGFITVGKPTAEAQKVIDAYRSLVAAKK